jgi:mono/diheme cytochrome c family protein
MKKAIVSMGIALAGGMLFVGTAISSAAAEESAKPYTVVCEGSKCDVDQATFVGWRTYHGFCAQCHAQDAVGSTFAPSLLTRMERVDRERLEKVVRDGFTGQMGVMPGFADNPNVMPRLDELYAYLKARSDGALASGRPGRLRELQAQQ